MTQNVEISLPSTHYIVYNRCEVDIRLITIPAADLYGGGMMAAMAFNSVFFNHEIPFCKVYGVDEKEKIEKLFLKNGISFCMTWQKDRLWERLRNKDFQGESVFTVHINEADRSRAADLIADLDCVAYQLS